jgi:cellulose synthase/poly-beta-1,6-N-acetylglucosamine synthase-like glycosyltransferase
MRSVAVCIPTRNDQNEPGKIHFPLVSLAMQTYQDFSVYIRDEGLRDIFADKNMRLILNLLEQKNIPIHYVRTQERKGAAFARRMLFETIQDEPLVLWLDDDMVVEPDVLTNLVSEIQSNQSVGFVQAVKQELDPFRKYHNDINVLNGEKSLPDKVKLCFGDTAILLVRAEALRSIDWDLVTRYQVDGLTGEDVTMSLLIAQHWDGVGINRAQCWHVSPSVERWNWEIHSDALQVELLKGQVDSDILRSALPHLARFIPNVQQFPTDKTSSE